MGTRTWRTWLDMHTPKPSTAEMADNAEALAAEARRRLEGARQRYRQAEPESPALFAAQDDIQKFTAEEKHWRRYASLYRQQLADERAAAERARCREVGADDGDDEGPLSAWQDIGAGPRP